MGEVFAGRYELLDVIGEGGMGSVWTVWDARREQVVAAKVLRQADAVSLLRFVREQAVRVRHPHVLTPLGWAGEDDRVLFTMPVVDGGSVATLVGDHGPLPPLLVAELLRQLLSALTSVHGAGIVHRDVKPANLLLVATGRARPHLLLTDFGIAVDDAVPRFTRTGGVTGTPGYIAPELEEGEDVGPTADLFAAGQVARAMLTAVRPTDPAAAVRPEGCPDALWTAVERLSDPDPDRRPASARAAAALLEHPALAWAAGATGEVEVLRQLPDPGRPWLGVSADDDLPTRAAAGAATPTLPPVVTHGSGGEAGTTDRTGEEVGSTDGVAASDAASPDRSRRTRALTAVAVGAVAVVVALVGWTAWGAGDDGSTSERDPSPSSSPSASVATAASTAATPSSSPSSSPSSGSVEVGVVVVSVGQPCTFSEVGLREETVDGDPVVCTRRADGRYAWDAPGGG